MPTDPPPKTAHRFCWNDIVDAQSDEAEEIPDEVSDLDRIITFVKNLKDEKSSN